MIFLFSAPEASDGRLSGGVTGIMISSWAWGQQTCRPPEQLLDFFLVSNIWMFQSRSQTSSWCSSVLRGCWDPVFTPHLSHDSYLQSRLESEVIGNADEVCVGSLQAAHWDQSGMSSSASIQMRAFYVADKVAATIHTFYIPLLLELRTAVWAIMSFISKWSFLSLPRSQRTSPPPSHAAQQHLNSLCLCLTHYCRLSTHLKHFSSGFCLRLKNIQEMTFSKVSVNFHSEQKIIFL